MQVKTNRANEKELIKENPLDLFAKYFKEVCEANPNNLDMATSFVLCTIDEKAVPSARVVLLKDFGVEGFVFYTNYNSNKAQQLELNPQACLNFYWSQFKRQIIVTGITKKVSRETSCAYFASRSRESQIGAYASQQSRELSSHLELEQRYKELENKFTVLDRDIPCPENWGGYILSPKSIEFWSGQAHRLHYRTIYTLASNGLWDKKFLNP